VTAFSIDLSRFLPPSATFILLTPMTSFQLGLNLAKGEISAPAAYRLPPRART
jgi:hypothetical protein